MKGDGRLNNLRQMEKKARSFFKKQGFKVSFKHQDSVEHIHSPVVW